MPDTGPALIATIVNKANLMLVNNCPGVPAEMGRAFYNAYQNDTGLIDITGGNVQKKISEVVGFGGSNSETAVWHFELTPVHHFVVVPWYNHDAPHGQVYTVFMAYENYYSLGQYINGINVVRNVNRPPLPGGDGYKLAWTVTELSTMLSDLLTDGGAWQRYFGQVGAAQATEMHCWKYKTITLRTAIANVNRY